jgi:hypothetical protein
MVLMTMVLKRDLAICGPRASSRSAPCAVAGASACASGSRPGLTARPTGSFVPVTDSFRHHIEERGAAADEITVVKNGVDLEQFSRPRKDQGLARELGLDGKFTAAYFGTHRMAHALDSVLRAAELPRDDRGSCFSWWATAPNGVGCRP